MLKDYFTDYELKDIVMIYFLSRMKLAGCEKENLTLLKEEIGYNFSPIVFSVSWLDNKDVSLKV